MLTALWLLIPEEAYGLILLGLFVAPMLGLLSPLKAFLFALLLILVGPMSEMLIDLLPDWAFWLLCLGCVVSLLGLIFGKSTRRSIFGWVLTLPFRVLGKLLFPFRASS